MYVFSCQVFEIQSVFYVYSSSRFGLTTFRVLSSHMWILNWTAQIYVPGNSIAGTKGSYFCFFFKAFGRYCQVGP